MNPGLSILCAGAVQGIVKALQVRFERDSGAELHVQFGAVGALKELFLSGHRADVMIATESMLASLQASGQLAAGAPARLGRVRTGIAVPDGQPVIDVSSTDSLRAALLDATGIYCPDAQRSTAGIHFASVLRKLGIEQTVAPRLHGYPNGAAAMAALAQAGDGALGCTQITEILYTDGISLIGPLPPEFELATIYSGALTSDAAEPELARRFLDMLAGPGTASMRRDGGFELHGL